MALDDNQPESLRLVLQMEVERYHLKTLTVMERSILETQIYGCVRDFFRRRERLRARKYERFYQPPQQETVQVPEKDTIDWALLQCLDEDLDLPGLPSAAKIGSLEAAA